MFSSAFSVGTRLKAWNTKPMRSRRNRVSWSSSMPVRSAPPIRTRPLVGVSSPARQCSSVDFPDPDGPMIAVSCPRVNATSTPARAVTLVSPWP